MTVSVSNILSSNTATVAGNGVFSDTSSRISPQGFGLLINQLLGVNASQSADVAVTQSLTLDLTAVDPDSPIQIDTPNAGVSVLPFTDFPNGNGLPYFSTTGIFPMNSETENTSTELPVLAVSNVDSQVGTIMSETAENAATQDTLQIVSQNPIQYRLDGPLRLNQAFTTTGMLSGDRDARPTLKQPIVDPRSVLVGQDEGLSKTTDTLVTSVLNREGALQISRSLDLELDAMLIQPQARFNASSSDNLSHVMSSPLGVTPSLSGNQSNVPTTLIDTLPVSPRHAEFNSELGQRLVWMMKNNVPMAEIRLNPPQLGPIEIRVSVTNDQASVWMNAHHSLTRDALEQALPRLREMLSDAGLNLSEANVSSNSTSQQQQNGRELPFYSQGIIDGDPESEGNNEEAGSEFSEQMFLRPAAIDYFA